MQIERFLSYLKKEAGYVIAPAEFVDKPYSIIIKFYNYKNKVEEENLKRLMTRAFRIPPDEIQVSYEENEKIKPTVEIWLGTKPIPKRPNRLQVQNR